MPRDLQIINQKSPAGEVDRAEDQALVHRQQHVSVTGNTLFVSKRFGKGLPEGDADIFHTVVVIDLGIPHAFYLKIKASVFCEQGQHMVEKSDTRINIIRSCPIQVQTNLNVSFARGSGDLCFPHALFSFSISLMVLTRHSIWSIVPMVIRLYSEICGRVK